MARASKKGVRKKGAITSNKCVYKLQKFSRYCIIYLKVTLLPFVLLFFGSDCEDGIRLLLIAERDLLCEIDSC